MSKKIFISVDMEGISGITNADECTYGDPAWHRFRKVMTDDVNAAIEGAFEGGATEILVNDAHGFMRNIMFEHLDQRAQIVSGRIKSMSMMTGFDGSFNGVFMVGAHAKAGSKGILSHTMFGQAVSRVLVNGKEVGEMGLNAVPADHYGVPVIMASGDTSTEKEAYETFGKIEFAVTKEDVTRFTARLYPLDVSRANIRAAAKRAVQNLASFEPRPTARRTTFTITFHGSNEAEYACLIPGVKRVDDRTVTFGSTNALEAYKLNHAVMTLAAVTTDVKYG